MSERNAPKWVKVLVVLHMAAVVIWTIPRPPEEALRSRTGSISPRNWIQVQNAKYLKSFQPVQTYLFTTGFWQYWDMFAPNPIQRDQWCDAIVTFHDGSEKRFQYPRIYELSIPEKYVKERFRKFYERGGAAEYTYFWRPFGQWVALQSHTDPMNPPIRVRLRRHTMLIAPPGKPQAKEYTTEEYFTYVVDQEKLKRDKASPL